MVARILFTLLAGLVLAAGSVRAQTIAPQKPLRVALAGKPPFIEEKQGAHTGLSIDVWQQIAADNTWSFVYTYYPNIQAALEAVSKGEMDILVGDISITSSLFKTVEFSQPYFRSGLQIMVAQDRPYTFGRLIEDVGAWAEMKLLWIALGIILLISVPVMLFERHHNKDFPKGWADGYAEALYYVVSLSLGKPDTKGSMGGWDGWS